MKFPVMKFLESIVWKTCIHWVVRSVIARSRDISKPRDWVLTLVYRSEIIIDKISELLGK